MPEVPAAAPPQNNQFLHVASLVALTAAAVTAGAVLRPSLERLRSRPAGAAETVALMEHAAVDVRLGRAGPRAAELERAAKEAREPATRQRLLGLWSEAALQAGATRKAEEADGLREPLAPEGEARNAIRLRRIGLAAGLGETGAAEELARPLLMAPDGMLADEARLRLVSAMPDKDLRAFIAGGDVQDREQERRRGLAALRLQHNPKEALRHLEPLRKSGGDDSLLQALVDCYALLDRPKDVASTIGPMIDAAAVQSRKIALSVVLANALLKTGDAAAAAAALSPFRNGGDLTARTTYFAALKASGKLDAERRTMRPIDRAFVALTIDRDYASAEKLYAAAAADSPEAAAGLREASRRIELGERRRLYEEVLAKDAGDDATRQKLIEVYVALGEADAVQKLVSQALSGRERSPEVLLAVAEALGKAGLYPEAAALLEKAYAAEPDAANKQHILFSLAALYSAGNRPADAERVYARLAAQGVSPDIQNEAVSRLATLLH
ncbi:MAG TPA: hypothetical protein VGH20_11135 [Myxococcales bacterium]